ncbi:isoleucine--tRNA ligase [Halobacterium salinarum]|uniref:isoleucine--tRNA ligase n=1 Tax=Halobacterium salinarum TaxID=2242 RepID=UPI002552F62F|nr:isoleucine--tRNA ligase [Halobacterium salinarum]MDL0123821.1 isoleucine--tRNA ligase [Halobacterium salinarum]
MSGFGDVPDQYDPAGVEERVFSYWEAVDAYEQTVDHRADAETFFFVDGPPYTSGAAHMGTTWNKTLKDAYIRYHRMQGYDVTDRPGYDMHGLPIETKVEEQLGFESKKDIQEFGEEAFIEECKRFADDNLDGLQSDFQSFGVWMDWDNPYKTVDPSYMEAAWWAFSEVHDNGLVERGQRSISQCPRCETAIANNEVEYEDVTDPSIYVRFDLDDREGSLVVWTTTPWTIPANQFVAVDEDGDYQQVRATTPDGETDVLYVASECVEDVLSAGGYSDHEVVADHSGSDLIGWSYTPPLADAVPANPTDADGTHEVYHGDWVEADRTGLVHSAPGHGEEDFERGAELDLPVFCPVGEDGVYTDAGGKYAGAFVRDANDDIIADLEARDAMLASQTVEHSYGHCWRCDTGIIQIVTDQWFITITDVKDELLANMDTSEWHPEWARDNRFRDFVENAPDWNVSRQRYWGIPVPIWTPEDWSGDAEDVLVVGTREELAALADQDVDPASVDLHKPTVDDITITEDGTEYTRVPDVFDVWLDSSVASWGTLNYPEQEDDFDELWPADLIMEAHDQTRGWFWSQLGMGTAALGDVPYEEVLMHGYANMPDGRGMSKSKGITIEPNEVIDEYGADPMRMFLLSVTPQGDDMSFSWDETENMQRDLNILWNVFRFPRPYMALDDFDANVPAAFGGDDAGVGIADADLETVDEWLLSRLQHVKADATAHWEDFEQHRALDAVLEFVVEDLSRYYVQVVRERMWEDDASASKTAAYATMQRVLLEVVALLAPYAPFVTEELYSHLTGDRGYDTVHMADWPTVEESLRAPALEADVAVLRAAEEAGSHARQQAGRKLRWPVTRVVVDAAEDSVVDALDAHGDLLADRLNTRAVEVVEPGAAWDELAYSARADMSELGPAFGDDAGAVMNALNDAHVTDRDIDALAEQVAADLGRDDIELTTEMVEFVEETPEHVAGAAFETETAAGTVYVDTELNEDVESEGYAREVVRRVQEMRKEMDLAMDAEIRLDVLVFDERVGELVARHEPLITEETRARELGEVEDGHREEWDVEGTTMILEVEAV